MSRSKWKGKFIDNLLMKNKTLVLRSSKIIPKFIGMTFNVYNGKIYQEITITKEMLYHKFGELFFTRKNFSFKKKK